MLTATTDSHRGGSSPRRRDAVRNRRRLLEAAGEILRTRPADVSMPVVANLAGLSVATAYRYFPTLDELLNTYLHQVITLLRDYSHDCPKTGAALFEDVVGEWGRLLQTYGAAMIQLRSRRGLLERLREGDPVITTVRDAWERPIRSLMRELGVADDRFDDALFLYNLLFDPREVLDLIGAGMSQDSARRLLVTTYYGALMAFVDPPVIPAVARRARREQP